MTSFDIRVDAEVPLLWARHLTVLGQTVNRGDPVTPEQRAAIGLKRLQLYWNSGTFLRGDSPEAARFIPAPVEKRRGRPPKPKPAAEEAAPAKRPRGRPKKQPVPIPYDPGEPDVADPFHPLLDE